MIKYSSEIKSMIFDSFINSIETNYTKEWNSNTLYYRGEQVIVSNKKYISLNNGISGEIAPNHISNSHSDGNVNWLFVENVNYTNIFQKNLYLGIGKMTEWENELIPDNAIINDENRLDTINNIVFLKKISKSDIAFMTEKNNWVNGFNYNKYNSSDNTVENTYCTIIDNNNDVLFYRCIDKESNNTLSTIQPNGEGFDNIILSDTYVWKFIGKINSSFITKFSTDNDYPIVRNNNQSYFNSINKLIIVNSSGMSNVFDDTDIIKYIPISLSSDMTGDGLVIDSSLNVINGGLNYNQDTYIAINKINMNGKNAHGIVHIVDGVIDNIIIDNQGTGYYQLDNNNNVIPVYGYIIGDGTGALVDINIDILGHVISVNVINGGMNYNQAKLIILHGKSVVCRIDLQPYGGHGYNLISELNSTKICLVTTISNDNEYVVGLINNKFRQISIITDILDIDNIFCRKEWYIAPSHIEWNMNNRNKINPLTGKILYLNNRQAYQISENQTENIKITLSL